MNTHDQLKAAGGGVALVVSYLGAREQHRDGYLVYRVNSEGREVVTDPKAAWYHRQSKHFSTFGYEGPPHVRMRQAAEDGMRWVAQRGWYDGPWVRNALQDWVPKTVNDRFKIRRRKNA